MKARRIEGLQQPYVGMDGSTEKTRRTITDVLQQLLDGGFKEEAKALATAYDGAVEKLDEGKLVQDITLRDILRKMAEEGSLENVSQMIRYYDLVERIYTESKDSDVVLVTEEEWKLLVDGSNTILDKAQVLGGRIKVTTVRRLGAATQIEIEEAKAQE